MDKCHADALFTTVDWMTNPPVSVAPEFLSTTLCNKFDSFIGKIQKIRRTVISSIVN